MKPNQLSLACSDRTVKIFAIVVLLLASAVCRSLAQQPTPEQRRALAHKIITDSARIKPHELVVISGNTAFMPFMEDLAVEASKVGGYAVLMPSTDSFIRSVLTEVPDQYLGQPDPTIAWNKSTDVFISLPGLYDEAKVMADIPQTKLAKLTAANQDEIREGLRASKTRTLYIDAPVAGQADLFGFDAPAFSAMQWEAIGADESSIEHTGETIAEMIKSAHSVRVTTPEGSDFTFQPGRYTPRIMGGVTHAEADWEHRNATLPAGSFATAVAAGTFQGTVFSPQDYCSGLVKLTNVSYQFSAGKMISFKAQENEKCLQDIFAAYSGSKDTVPSVQIGLNPALKTRSKSAPYNTAGMFWVLLGRDDRFGATGTGLNWMIPVANATVSVDGKKIIENGQLLVQ